MKAIALIYPGFPHYRSGIIKELINSKKYKYEFAGDKKGYNNVKPYVFKLTDYKIAFKKADIGVFLVAHAVFKKLHKTPNKVILDFCGIYK